MNRNKGAISVRRVGVYCVSTFFADSYPMTRSDVVSDTSGLFCDVRTLAVDVAVFAAGLADRHDCDGAFPGEEIEALYRSGLLLAPFPRAMGGCDLGSDPDHPLELRDVLVCLGQGSLALGRLYEGHVNAIKLVRLYGDIANLDLLHAEARAGFMAGVWMAEDDAPLRLIKNGAASVLAGRKILASGSGHIRRPLVAARTESDTSQMVLPFVSGQERVDTSDWTALGMKATATGCVTFTGLPIGDAEIVGQPGDYLKSPYFRGGAWRVLAVQLGGLEAVLNLYRLQLLKSPHADNPIQLARFGEAKIAVETARLWVRQACLSAERPSGLPAVADAYVDLARNAFETAALRTIGLAQKAIGLKAFMRPNPLERIIRDLSTYLRQPALDLSLIAAGRFYLRAAAADDER